MVQDILDQLWDINFFTLRRQLAGKNLQVRDIFKSELFKAPDQSQQPVVVVYDDDEEDEEAEDAADEEGAKPDDNVVVPLAGTRLAEDTVDEEAANCHPERSEGS